MPVIRLSSVTSSSSTAKYKAPLTGITGLYLFGTGLDATANRIQGSVSGSTRTGAVNDYTGYSTFKGLTDYVTTPLPDTADMTVLTVGRFLDDGSTSSLQGILYGNYARPLVGGNSGGVSIYQTTNSLSAGAPRGNGSGGVVSGIATFINDTNNASAWALYQHDVPASGVNKISNLTAGTYAMAGAAADPVHKLTISGGLRIGSGYSTFLGRVDVSLVIFANRLYTAPELVVLQGWARGLALQQGLVV